MPKYKDFSTALAEWVSGRCEQALKYNFSIDREKQEADICAILDGVGDDGPTMGETIKKFAQYFDVPSEQANSEINEIWLNSIDG